MRHTLWAATVVAMVTTACSGAPSPTPPAAHSPSGQTSGTPAADVAEAPPAPSAELDWQRIANDARAMTTRLPQGHLTLSGSRREVRVRTGQGETELSAGPRRRIDEVLVSPPYVVVVAEDEHEEWPAAANVIDLRDGEVRSLGGEGAPRLIAGGSWAAAEGVVAYPARRGADYCIALVDLASGKGDTQHCVPPGNGLSQFNLSAHGLGFMSFDDRRPVACRAVNVLEEGQPAARFTAAEPCRPWEIVPLGGGAAVWSEIIRERMIEQARFRARTADGQVVNLGVGVTGSLTWCNGAAYFSRNPLKDSAAGQLLRWSPDRGLQEAYAAKPSTAVTVGPARCAGDTVSLSVYSGASGYQIAALAH